MSGRGVRSVLVALALMLGASGLRPRTAPPPRVPGAPPAVALASVGLGGLNGLVVDYLWLHASAEQAAGNYWEVLQTTRWITALQPRLASVYEFQAWNLARHIADLFDDPRDHWRWVARGLDLLYDQGLRHNPDDPELCRALAVLLTECVGVGGETDRAHYARQAFAATPRFAGRLEPARVRQLEARYGRLDWRCASSHAFYWATLGDELGGGQRRYQQLTRWRCAALLNVVAAGTVIERPALGLFFLVPRPTAIEGLLKLYDEAARALPAGDGGLVVGRAKVEAQARLLRLAYGDGELKLDAALTTAALDCLADRADGPAAGYADLFTRAELCRRVGEPFQARGLERLAQLGVAAYNATQAPPLSLEAVRRAGLAGAQAQLRQK